MKSRHHIENQRTEEEARPKIDLTTAFPKKENLLQFFRLCKDDLIVGSFSIIITICVWSIYFIRLHKLIFWGHGFSNFFSKTSYICFLSFFSAFLFRRLLVVYHICENKIFSTLLFCVFPVRFLLFKSLGSYDIVFLSLILLSLIFYKIDAKIPLFITLFIGSFIRIEFLILHLTCIICYLLSRNIKDASIVAIIGIITLIIIRYRHKSLNDLIGAEFRWKPYHFFNDLSTKIQNLRVLHSLHGVFFPSLLGSAILLYRSIPISVFCFLYTLFLSCIKSSDMHRFAIPVHIFSIICGFDSLLSAQKFVIICISPILFLVGMKYCSQQFKANRELTKYL